MTIEKGLIGKEDMEFGTGSFNRKGQTGFDISLSKVNASHVPIIDSGGLYTAADVDGALQEIRTTTLLSYAVADLPAAGTAGRLAWVTDNIRGVWRDDGTQWVSVTGVANVLDFGAYNDGTNATATRAAIQAAIDAIPAEGGTVFIPAGSYIVDATLVPASNMTIQGAGMGVTVIQTSGTTFTIMKVTTVHSNVTYRDFTLDGNAKTGGENTNGLLHMGSATDCLVERVETRYGAYNGMYVGGEATRVKVKNCRSHNNGDTSWGHGFVFWNKIRECSIMECESYSNLINGIWTGVNLPTESAEYNSHIIISNNLCYDNAYSGIYVDSASYYTTVENNICYNNALSNITVFGGDDVGDALGLGTGITTTINQVGGIGAADVTIVVTSALNFPYVGYPDTPTFNAKATGFVRIDSEDIRYTFRTPDSLRGCTRGMNGTTPATHADGATVSDTLGTGISESVTVNNNLLYGGTSGSNPNIDVRHTGDRITVTNNIIYTVLGSGGNYSNGMNILNDGTEGLNYIISGNTIHNCNIGLNLTGLVAPIISNNQITESRLDAINLDHCPNFIITGNIIREPNQSNAASAGGIKIVDTGGVGGGGISWNGIIANNQIIDVTPYLADYALDLTGLSTTYGCMIRDNMFVKQELNYTYTDLNVMLNRTASTQFRNNIGYKTESGGISPAIATGGSIAHGLIAAPAKVQVTAAESGPTDLYIGVDATNITVNFGGGGSKTFYWSATVYA